MPMFSIVIPTYNAENYLRDCLDSILKQDFDSWEALVVVDCSPDGSLQIAREYEASDNRVRVVSLEQNQGLHLARKHGVEQATGDYTLFLDADDEFAPGFLDALAQRIEAHGSPDIMHFGLRTIVEDKNLPSMEEFDSWANWEFPPLVGDQILESVFFESKGFKRDWRVTQRAVATALAKEAFGRMVSTRLECAEDAYEYYVMASLAQLECSCNDITGCLYHIGRGITNTRVLDIPQFESLLTKYRRCIDAVKAYAADASDTGKNAADGLVYKLLDIIGNDWLNKTSDANKVDALASMGAILGSAEAATQGMRCARDLSHALLTNGCEPQDIDRVRSWYLKAQDLAAGSKGSLPGTYVKYLLPCKANLDALDRRLSSQTLSCARSQQGIRIFVSTHKVADMFDSLILQPVQVGSATAKSLFPDCFHDDSGENISLLNPQYCELTTQYWAWKNAKADYYGFCHYRRYFDFSSTKHQENAYGEIMAPRINAQSQAEYGLDDATIARLVEGTDIVTTEIKDIRTFPGGARTMREQYKNAPYLKIADLDLVCDIVRKNHPDYQQDVDSYLNGSRSCFCNMFIMRRDLFDDYCAWLFPILDEFCRQRDMSTYSKEGLRTPGHLAERLFNIYLVHLKRTNPSLKHKQLQTVHFLYPEPTRVDFPLPPDHVNRRPTIPVVFAADDAYVPMVATTICSVLQNASNDYRYDVVILERNISSPNKQLLEKFVNAYPNAYLRFVNVGDILDKYSLQTNNPHISVETYYRFLIQELLPFYDKVLYLDSDLIVEGDVSELYQTYLGDNLLAAVRDADYLGNLNMNDGKRIAYTKNVLKMRDPYAYFQAGVLVLNTAAMRELHPVTQWLEIASNPAYIYNDQDVLNQRCEGRVTYLDYRWNVMHDCGHRVQNVFSFAPAAVYDAYMASRSDPLVIHYAGYEKPWKSPFCDFATRYWAYAKSTPFYEQLLSMASGIENAHPGLLVPLHERALSETSGLRRYIDPLAPIGSQRREVIKSMARMIQGKK